MKLETLLAKAVEMEASDLHIVAGIPPSVRIDGEIQFLECDKLSGEDTKNMIYEVLTEEQVKRFENEWELEFSYADDNHGRFRASIYYEKGNIEASFRVVPLTLKNFSELGLPPIIEELALKPNGLVLVTGPTGMGKTTTLNAMIDLINKERRYRIITIEDPIEFVHKHNKSVIIQREVDTDTHSFYDALIHSLRQDPNVICVGEMRDLETISTAVTAAETGHLVLSTLHTSDATQTIDRIIDIFPPHQQAQIQIQLSNCLQGVISQLLLPRVAQRGRVLALEILVATNAVRNLVRKGKTDQIPNVISMSSDFGMIDMDKSIKSLYEQGIITYDTAMSKVKEPADFKLR
ncbi:MAG: type IV pilus twitching motility protein PilT [Chloroflexi bacterium]|nr:type IV pilus twitching motility protein PilT [Chloroflexota bacterium]